MHRLRRLRGWRLLVVVSVVVVAAYFLVSSVLLVLGVVDNNKDGDVMKAAAVAALPANATVTSGPFVVRSSARALVVATSPQPPSAVLDALRIDGEKWTEVAGTRTARSRSFLSAEKSRILTVTAIACSGRVASCPVGGSQIESEVAVGGPNS